MAGLPLLRREDTVWNWSQTRLQNITSVCQVLSLENCVCHCDKDWNQITFYDQFKQEKKNFKGFTYFFIIHNRSLWSQFPFLISWSVCESWPPVIIQIFAGVSTVTSQRHDHTCKSWATFQFNSKIMKQHQQCIISCIYRTLGVLDM